MSEIYPWNENPLSSCFKIPAIGTFWNTKTCPYSMHSLFQRGWILKGTSNSPKRFKIWRGVSSHPCYNVFFRCEYIKVARFYGRLLPHMYTYNHPRGRLFICTWIYIVLLFSNYGKRGPSFNSLIVITRFKASRSSAVLKVSLANISLLERRCCIAELRYCRDVPKGVWKSSC